MSTHLHVLCPTRSEYGEPSNEHLNFELRTGAEFHEAVDCDCEWQTVPNLGDELEAVFDDVLDTNCVCTVFR